MRRAGNESQPERAEDQGWCGPLITCLDPPFRSVIGGGGPVGPRCPMGSAPTLLSNLHLKLAAGGGKMTWVGVSTKLGRTQRQPPVLASWEGVWKSYETPEGALSHPVPVGTVLSKLVANQPSLRGTASEGSRAGEKAGGQSGPGASLSSSWQIRGPGGCRPCWGL